MGRISTESFDDVLAEQGTLEGSEDLTISQVLAWQIAEGMKAEGITKTVMAHRMKPTGGSWTACLIRRTNP